MCFFSLFLPFSMFDSFFSGFLLTFLFPGLMRLDRRSANTLNPLAVVSHDTCVLNQCQAQEQLKLTVTCLPTYSTSYLYLKDNCELTSIVTRRTLAQCAMHSVYTLHVHSLTWPCVILLEPSSLTTRLGFWMTRLGANFRN